MADDPTDDDTRTLRPLHNAGGQFASRRGGRPTPPSGGGLDWGQLGISRVWLLLGAVVALLVVAYVGFTARVDAGEACAVTRFGGLARESGPGLHLKVPIFEQYHCYRTATTFYEVLDDQSSSRADFQSGALDGVTRDGQRVDLTFNVRYQIPADQVNEIYSQIGKTDRDVNERVVVFHSRTIVRQFVQQYSAEQLYSGDLAAVSQGMQDELTPLFAASFIQLQYFEIKRPRFDEAYEDTISQKQIALEQIETRANEASAAEQEAIGVANRAQGESNAQRIRAQGEAEAIRLRGQAVRDNPEIIQLNYIDALRTINWAILDSGDVNQFLAITPPAGDPTQGGGPAASSPTATPTATTPSGGQTPAAQPTPTAFPTQETTP